MRDAEAREGLYQKYKKNPCFAMFDVYIQEAHPDQNPYGYGEPKTFDERIKLLERYRNDKKMTVPILVDNMQDSWKALYTSRPTSCILIDIDGKVVYTIDFILANNQYPNIDKAVGDLLAKTNCNVPTLLPVIKPKTHHNPIITLTKNSVYFQIPENKPYTVALFSVMGQCLFLRETATAGTFTARQRLPAGSYIAKIRNEQQTWMRAVTVK
jgi:hypothetical protein